MKYFTLITTLVASLVMSSCVAPVFIKPTPVPQPDGQDYYWPHYTAEVIENDSGFFVSVSADQRTEEIGHLIVTVDGVEKCNEDVEALVGTCFLGVPDGELHHVKAQLYWREAVETLWEGFIL
jgi:hypothetical protein